MLLSAWSIQVQSFNLETDLAATYLRQKFIQDNICEISLSVL